MILTSKGGLPTEENTSLYFTHRARDTVPNQPQNKYFSASLLQIFPYDSANKYSLFGTNQVPSEVFSLGLATQVHYIYAMLTAVSPCPMYPYANFIASNEDKAKTYSCRYGNFLIPAGLSSVL